MTDHQRLPEPIHLATVGHFLRSMPSSTADLLDLAREKAPDPSVFDSRSPAFWAATISTNKMDFYGTRMHDTTLANFATALNTGVAYQHSHDVREYIGHSLAGEMVVGGGEVDEFGIQVKQVNGVFFTIPGIKLGSMGTTDFIDAIRAGVLRDVSVGFWADDIRCSICGSQLFYSMWWGWDGDCRHIPTMTYDVLDADGNPVTDASGLPQKQTCWGWVYGGELGETSSVYDGATPGAAVYKAQLMAEAGLLNVREASAIEARYRVRLPERRISRRGFESPMPTEQTAGADSRSTENQNETEPTGRVIVELDGREVEGVIASADELADELAEATDAVEQAIERVKKAGFEIARGRVADVVRDFVRVIERQRDKILDLDAEAAIGREYRQRLIDAAIKAGIRAKGEKFKEETWRSMLGKLGIDEIELMTEGWVAEGDAYLAGKTGSVGGRSTVEQAEGPVEEAATPKRKRSTDYAHAG